METVNNEATLLLILYQAGVTEDAEMMRDVDDLGIKQGGQLADVAASAAQAVNDPQPLRVRQSAKGAGATVGLQWLAHDTFPCSPEEVETLRQGSLFSIPHENALLQRVFRGALGAGINPETRTAPPTAPGEDGPVPPR